MWSGIRDMARQADLQELVQTAFVAVVFGFMLSKLVSMLIAIRSSNLRLERIPENPDENPINPDDSSSDSSKEEVHSADSDGDRADVSGLSEGRADFSEVSESGGLEESSSAFPSGFSEQEGIASHEHLPHIDRGYEPSTSSEDGRAEETRTDLKHQKPDQVVVQEEDDDTSDWEGVESTELDEAFGAASSYIATIAGGLKVPSDIQLQLYGLYKVATEGTCHTPQPSALKMTARAKWNAWQKLGTMSQEEAMERYVKLVSEICPEWSQAANKKKDGEGTSGNDAPKRGQMGPVFSTLAYEDKSDEGTLEALHVAARENDERALLELLDQGVFVDIRDSDGRTPLHWAADRGNVNMANLLLSRGADIHAKDKEGQTALHYATVCEQEAVAKELCEKGADANAADGEGATPLSFCPTNWSWMKA